MSALGTPGDGAMGLKSPVVRTFSVESVGQKSWAEYKARNVPDVVSRSPEALPSPSSSLTTSRKGHRLPVAFQLPDGRSGESKTSPNTPLRSPGSPSLTHVSTPPSASINNNNNNNNNNNHNSSSGNMNSNDDNASLKKSSPASPGRAQYVPSCVVTVRGGDGHSEKLLFEGVAWGVVTVAMQRARQKVGRVTAAVVNQASRVLYITGPGLPVTGVPLHMAKTGFRGSLAGLEETFRNSGVKFNFDIRASPKADNTDLHALLANAQSRAGELPRCQLPTETIMTYVKRYAIARAEASASVLQSYRDQLRVEGISIDNDGEQWVTKDGRKGPVPWIDKGSIESRSPAAAQREPAAAAASTSPAYQRKHTVPQQLAPDVRGRVQSATANYHRTASAPTTATVSKRSKSNSTSRQSRMSTPTPGGSRASWRPTGPGPNSFSAFDSFSTSGSRPTWTRSRRSNVTNRYNLRDLMPAEGDSATEAPKYVVGPCILHVPATASVCVEPEYGLKPLKVVLHDGGRVVTKDLASARDLNFDKVTGPEDMADTAADAAARAAAALGFSPRPRSKAVEDSSAFGRNNTLPHRPSTPTQSGTRRRASATGNSAAMKVRPRRSIEI